VVVVVEVPKQVSSALQHEVSRQVSQAAVPVLGATPHVPASSVLASVPPSVVVEVSAAVSASPASSVTTGVLSVVVDDEQPTEETQTNPNPNVAHQPMILIYVIRSLPEETAGAPINEKKTWRLRPQTAPNSREYPKKIRPGTLLCCPSRRATILSEESRQRP
jgi:hypothetical protein